MVKKGSFLFLLQKSFLPFKATLNYNAMYLCLIVQNFWPINRGHVGHLNLHQSNANPCFLSTSLKFKQHSAKVRNIAILKTCENHDEIWCLIHFIINMEHVWNIKSTQEPLKIRFHISWSKIAKTALAFEFRVWLEQIVV